MLYTKQWLLSLALAGGFLLGHPVVTNPIVSNAVAPQHAQTATTQSNTSNPTASEATAGANLSANWAGYVANTNTTSYTAVGATWIVPAVAVDSGTAASADATWVGIGGVSSHDLIQSGTQATVQDGQISYQAWIETLPQVLEPIPLTIHAGDSVTVSLAEQSPGQWGLSFHNNTTGNSYQSTIAYNSSKSSAEWIEEMPVGGTGRVLGYLPLDNFGSVTFTDAYTIANGSTQNLSSASAQPLSMAASGRTLLASTSELTNDGAGFSVTRTTAAAQVAQSASTTGRWRRTGVGYRRYTITSPSSSSSAPSTSTTGDTPNAPSQPVTQISVTPGQWTVIPLSSGGMSGWAQILFR